MKIYDDVKLNTELEELAAKGIHKEETGLLLEINVDNCFVMFLNSKNYGDYAFVKVNKRYIDVCDFKYGKDADELKKMIASKDLTKDRFKPRKFFEYDKIELTAEKNKYAQYGIHKGMQGTIMDEECIDSDYYVIFSDYDTGDDIADLCVNEDDMKLVYRKAKPENGDI